MIGRTNTGGGGGGGLSPNSAVIHVTAPVGSTISFAKGGVVAKVLGPDKSHVSSSDVSLAEWYYSVSSSNYGSWRVTATLDTDEAYSDIVVNSNKQYDVEITYHFYLYNKGEEFTDLTGGWTGNGIFEKRSNGLFFQTTTNGSRSWAETVSRTVNFSPYTSIVFRCSEYTGVNANWPQFGILRSGQGIVSYVAGGVGSGPKTITLPCGTYTSGGIQAVSQNAGESVLIESVWLE